MFYYYWRKVKDYCAAQATTYLLFGETFAELFIRTLCGAGALTYHDTPSKMPLIEEFVNMATVLQLDSTVTKKAIEIRRKHRKLKLGDAIIGATAIIHNLTLITNNVKDFANIKDLKIKDLHSL